MDLVMIAPMQLQFFFSYTILTRTEIPYNGNIALYMHLESLLLTWTDLWVKWED